MAASCNFADEVWKVLRAVVIVRRRNIVRKEEKKRKRKEKKSRGGNSDRGKDERRSCKQTNKEAGRENQVSAPHFFLCSASPALSCAPFLVLITLIPMGGDNGVLLWLFCMCFVGNLFSLGRKRVLDQN